MPSLWVNIHLKLSIFYRGPSKDAALEKFKRAMSSPITPSSFGLSHSINDEMWTPSAVLALDESTDIQDFRLARRNVQDPVQVFNACIDSLSDAVQKPRITYLESQADCWENGLFLKNLNLFKKLGKRARWCAMSWLQEMVKRYSRRSRTMSSWNGSARQLLMLAFNPYDRLSKYSHKITKDSNTEYLSALIDSQPTNLNAYISHLKTSPIDK